MKTENSKVTILLSSYNGAAYIGQQIDSVLSQNYPYLELYIRDDGSEDHTVDLLRRNYASQTESIHIVEGENVGFARSFYRLLKEAEEGEYWAFCDQDDVWYPDKIGKALNWLEHQENDLPLLFHSAYETYTQDLAQKTGTVLPPAQPVDFRRAMTDCVYQGFSMVINRPLREQLLRCREENLGTHDWMAMLIAVAFGRHHYDNIPVSMHRRLSGSLSAMDFKSRFRWFLRTLTEESDTRKMLREFERVFGGMLPEEKAGILRRFTKEGFHCKDSLWKAFYPGRWRPCLSSEAAVRLLMLFGRI